MKGPRLPLTLGHDALKKKSHVVGRFGITLHQGLGEQASMCRAHPGGMHPHRCRRRGRSEWAVRHDCAEVEFARYLDSNHGPSADRHGRCRRGDRFIRRLQGASFDHINHRAMDMRCHKDNLRMGGQLLGIDANFTVQSGIGRFGVQHRTETGGQIAD